MMLYDLAAVWAKVNFSHRPAYEDFLNGLKAAIKHGMDCSFVIGPYLTTKQKPYLVWGMAGQLFVFTLSREQAKTLGAIKGDMAKTERQVLVGQPLGGELPISVSKLEIDSKRFLKYGDRIAGRCNYEVMGDVPESIAACLEYSLAGREKVYSWITRFQPLDKSGKFEFSFSSIRESASGHNDAWSGTTAVFFRFLTMPNRSSMEVRMPLCHPIGTLIDVYDR